MLSRRLKPKSRKCLLLALEWYCLFILEYRNFQFGWKINLNLFLAGSLILEVDQK